MTVFISSPRGKVRRDLSVPSCITECVLPCITCPWSQRESMAGSGPDSTLLTSVWCLTLKYICTRTGFYYLHVSQYYYKDSNRKISQSQCCAVPCYSWIDLTAVSGGEASLICSHPVLPAAVLHSSAPPFILLRPLLHWFPYSELVFCEVSGLDYLTVVSARVQGAGEEVQKQEQRLRALRSYSWISSSRNM